MYSGDTSQSSDEEDFFSTIKKGKTHENTKQLESYLSNPDDAMDVLAACERLFSTAGLILRTWRARIGSKNFENQLLLKPNKTFCYSPELSSCIWGCIVRDSVSQNLHGSSALIKLIQKMPTFHITLSGCCAKSVLWFVLLPGSVPQPSLTSVDLSFTFLKFLNVKTATLPAAWRVEKSQSLANNGQF